MPEEFHGQRSLGVRRVGHNGVTNTFTFIADSLRCIAETDTTLQSNYTSIKKKKTELNNATCSNTDGPGDYYPKCKKSDRERLYDIAYMWNLKRKKKLYK